MSSQEIDCPSLKYHSFLLLLRVSFAIVHIKSQNDKVYPYNHNLQQAQREERKDEKMNVFRGGLSYNLRF